jgi:collagenase-like PrtC family protease
MNIGYDGADSGKITALNRIFTIGNKRNFPVKQHLATCMEILHTRNEKFLSNINAALHPNVKEEDPVEAHIKNS